MEVSISVSFLQSYNSDQTNLIIFISVFNVKLMIRLVNIIYFVESLSIPTWFC